MNKIAFKILEREEHLPIFAEVSEVVTKIIKKTATSAGSNINLIDGSSIDDGINVIRRLESYKMDLFEDGVKNSLLALFMSKLSEAAGKTEELAGDGTTATTILINALLHRVNSMVQLGVSHIEITNKLKEFERLAMKFIEENKQDFKTKEDFVMLATTASKDENLGKLIGEAIFDAGATSSISLAKSTSKKDYVKNETQFILPCGIQGNGLPEYMKDVKVIVLDDDFKSKSIFSKSISKYVYDNKVNVLIVGEGIQFEDVQYINALNKQQGDRGLISFMYSVKAQSKYIGEKEILNDIAAYVGSEDVYSELYFENNAIEDKHFGNIDEFEMAEGYARIVRKAKHPKAVAKIKQLEEEVKSIDNDIENEKAKALKQRINMLDGKTTTLFIYAINDSEYTTKVERIRDAVKSTEFSSNFGWVEGAGKFYLDASSKIENEFAIELREVTKAVYDIAGKSILATKESDTKCLYIDKDGNTEMVDAKEKGIIDSAKVVENVIRNSVSVIKEFVSIGAKVVSYEK